jgi:hypothetical protein
MSKELVKKAIELGIENAEALTASQLKLAIVNAEKKIAQDAEIVTEATELGLVVEGKSVEELVAAIVEFQKVADEIAKAARDAELLAILSDYLGISDIDSLSKEEVVALLEAKKADEAAGIEVVLEPVQEGRTDEAATAANGLEYMFKEDAPASFRYLGQHRTQKEWIADVDAIDLMVAGKLSFLTLKK